jgi:hypothetical protein
LAVVAKQAIATGAETHETPSADGCDMSTLIMFRDWDVWYKPPLYRQVSWREYNKTGYVSKGGWVVYPCRHSIIADRIERITKRNHTLVPLTFMSNSEDVEKFFIGNKPNVELFFQGLNALARRDNAFFEFPVRLPILPPVNAQEFYERWERMRTIVRPTDCIMVFDTRSFISRTIALIDRGVWSHVAGYAGDGNIFEMILSGAVERPLDTYRSPRYRIGIYRARLFNGDVYASENARKIESFRSYWRANIGRSKYGYRQLFRVAVLKTLGIRVPGSNDSDVTPNDMARSPDFGLIYTI